MLDNFKSLNHPVGRNYIHLTNEGFPLLETHAGLFVKDNTYKAKFYIGNKEYVELNPEEVSFAKRISRRKGWDFQYVKRCLHICGPVLPKYINGAPISDVSEGLFVYSGLGAGNLMLDAEGHQIFCSTSTAIRISNARGWNYRNVDSFEQYDRVYLGD